MQWTTKPDVSDFSGVKWTSAPWGLPADDA
jgi:hypothetical protein